MQNCIWHSPVLLLTFYQAKLLLSLASNHSPVQNSLLLIAVHVSKLKPSKYYKSWKLHGVMSLCISLINEDTEVVIEQFESLLVADEEWNTWGKEYKYLSIQILILFLSWHPYYSVSLFFYYICWCHINSICLWHCIVCPFKLTATSSFPVFKWHGVQDVHVLSPRFGISFHLFTVMTTVITTTMTMRMDGAQDVNCYNFKQYAISSLYLHSVLSKI
jgi:hypothetical protein